MKPNEDDQLKDFFNDRPQDDQFTFDQDNWEKLSTVLKNERKNEKRMFIYLNILALFVGITAICFLNAQSIEDTQLPSTQYNKVAPLQKSDDREPSAEKAIREEQTIAAKIPSKKTKLFPGEERKIKNEKEQIVFPSVAATSARSEIRLNAKIKSKESVSLQGATINQQPINEIPNEGTIQPEQQINPAETVSNAASESSFAPIAMNAPTNSERSEFNSDSVLRSQDSTPVNKIQNNAEPFVPGIEKDSVAQALTLSKDSTPPKAALKNMFFLEIGADYLFGWKGSNREAAGFNPILGISYYNAITPKIGLSIGAHYTAVNNLTATSHTSTATKLKFGEESDVTVISAKQMYYVTMPIKMYYAIDSKNCIGAGYTIGYLLDVNSTVESYSKRKNYQSESEFSTAMGYRSGFNPFDGQLAVCYRRYIYKGLFVNGEFFYGLMDIKDDLVYRTNAFERNTGIKLSLSFNLLNK